MNKNKKFFVPEYECTDQFKSNNIPVYQQLGSDVLEQLEANVKLDEADDTELSTLNKQFRKARIQKIQVDTRAAQQKLQYRKKLLFAEWSQKFFDCFAKNFGKMRNMVVELHLNEEQVNKFKQTLELCLKNMELYLDEIWNDFQSENEDDDANKKQES